MPSLTLRQLAGMVEGEVIRGPDVRVSSVVIDSREVRPDSVFFAIRGHRLDGHDFLPQALQTAPAAVVDRNSPAPEGAGIVCVADTTRALQSLAREVRRQFPFLLIAITGSVGKTTTKEMIATLVGTERRTWRSWGNFNNQIGCPLCIANTPDDTDVVVSEMGMSAKGEIEFLARLTPPDIGVYTNIRPVHLEFFDSIDGIAAAKRELLENLAPDGSVVLNADDFRVMGIAEGFSGRKVTYGVEAEAEFRARDLRHRGLLGSRFTLESEGENRTIELALPGRHNLENALAAIATARLAGISWSGIEKGLRELKPAQHRGVLVEWRGATLYDDTYNSNPYALERALELLAGADCKGRRIAVIGDMLELGPQELRFHFEAGKKIPRGVEMVVSVGRRAKETIAGAREAGLPSDSLYELEDPEQAAGTLKNLIRPGDLVLLKGSRGIGLDRVIAALEKEG